MFSSSKSVKVIAFSFILAALLPLNIALASGRNDNVCLSNSQVLPINNSQMLGWKNNSRNGFQARGHASGVVDQIFPDRNGHKHFSLKIGSGPEDHVEIIYNTSFGEMADPEIGARVEACGDYITSNAPNNGYPASPDGAIIHWVHRSNNSKHESGFVIIGNSKYGFSLN